MSIRRLLAVLLVCHALGSPRAAAAQTAGSAATVPPAGPVVAIRLANNSLILGSIVREEGDAIVFDAGPLGQMTIKRADIAAQLDAPALAAVQAPPAPPPPPPAAGPPQTGIGGFGPPGKPLWTRSADFAGSFTSAAFKQGQLDPNVPVLTGKLLQLPGEQYTIQTQLSIMRSTSLRVAFVDASFIYAVYQPFGTQAKVPKFSAGYNFRQRDGQPFFVLTRYSWYTDDVRHIDYSHQAFVGLGAQVLQRKVVKLGLVPVVGVIREAKGIPKFDGRWLAGWGGLEQLVIAPNALVQIENRELFHQAFNDSSFRGIESYLGVRATIVKKIALTVGFTHNYDNVIAQSVTVIPPSPLGPGFGVLANTSSQVMLTTGIHIGF